MQPANALPLRENNRTTFPPHYRTMSESEPDTSEMDRKSLVEYIIQLKEAKAVLERRLQEGA